MKTLKYIAGFAGVLLSGAVLAASCQREDVKAPAPAVERHDVSFRVAPPQVEETKVLSPLLTHETAISRWALFIYGSDGSLVSKGHTASSESMLMSMAAGDYSVVAVVNYPVSGAEAFDPASDYSRPSLLSTTLSLGANDPACLVMVGQAMVSVSGSGTRVIPVTRLVSRVGVVSISRTAGSSAQFNGSSLTITRLYLSNVVTRDRFDGSIGDGITGVQSNWYCREGVTGSDTALNALTVEEGLSIGLPVGGSHTDSHYFYTYPNPVSADSRAAAWSVRHTRLVIEANVGGQVCYYPVTIPVMTANVSYNLTVVISNYGSGDPELEVPVGLEVSFSSSVNGWSGPVNVNETS